jgi:hypothetical protein
MITSIVAGDRDRPPLAPGRRPRAGPGPGTGPRPGMRAGQPGLYSESESVTVTGGSEGR